MVMFVFADLTNVCNVAIFTCIYCIYLSLLYLFAFIVFICLCCMYLSLLYLFVFAMFMYIWVHVQYKRLSSYFRDILDQYGTAVDAAIATLICCSVRVPQSMGIGGGTCFKFQSILYHENSS